MHKITSAILVAFNAAHQAAANMTVAVRAKLVDLHVASLSAMVKRADARTGRFRKLAAYHRAQAQQAQELQIKALNVALAVSKVANVEAAKHGVTKYF